MNEDPEYIAKLEKAISQKYGAKTIANPKSHWDEEKEKSYIKDRKVFHEKIRQRDVAAEKEEVDGFLVSKKLINRKSLESCTSCGKYSTENRDTIYFRKYECCYECYIQFVDGREERWLSGWRPEGENYVDKNSKCS